MQYSAKRNSDGTELTFTRPLKDGKARGFTYLLISVLYRMALGPHHQVRTEFNYH